MAPPAPPARRRRQHQEIAVIGSMTVRTSRDLGGRKAAQPGVLLHRRFVVREVDAEGLVIHDVGMHPLRLARELRQRLFEVAAAPLS